MKRVMAVILSACLCLGSVNFVLGDTGNENWKSAYINYLRNGIKNNWAKNGKGGYSYEGYALIDIDGNDIPELYMMGNSTASGDKICTYNNGKVVEAWGWVYGISYVKGKNLLNISGGHMDVYFDHIYKIENGEFVQIHKGDYGAEDNSNVKFDENDMPIYKYEWDGKKVSKSEYESLLNSTYNQYMPKYAYEETCGESEIFNKIANYKSEKTTYITVILNGNKLTFSENPYIENGTTMVPMRAIFEVLGASVDYDTETKAITATKGSTVIKLFANSDTATVNGKEVTLTSPVANKNGTTMVPLRLVSEALGAEVSWDAETKVVTINLDKEVTDKMVFSSNDTSLSFKVGEDIIIGVGLDKDNVTDEELNNIKISMDDRYSVVPYDSKIVDNKKYFYFKANTEGNYSIYAENSKTGESVEIPLSINKNKTYNIGSVPTQKVDGEDVIVNNFSGMTIDNYKEEKLKNGSCNVSFDVYNTKSVYGEVEVYDSNGKIISAKPIEKNSDSATSMKGALLDNIKDLYGDIVEGTVFTYKQKSGYSKKTSVSVNIPKDGYIKITNDVKESYMVGVLNITDLCLQTKQILSVAGKTDSNMENKVVEKITSKEFLNKISEKLFENQGEFSEKVAEKLTNKIVFSADGIGNFLNSLSDIMNEADIDDIVESALIESGASIGQDVFTNVAGPAGTGLKVVFKVAEIENVILSIRHFETSLDKGAIVIQNK